MATKAKADKAAKAKADKADAQDPAALAAVDHDVAKYSKADQKKIAQLKDKGVTLDGTETSEDLDAHLEALEESASGAPAKEDPDLPNMIQPRYQNVKIHNKDRRFPIHFVHSVGEKAALYNEKGQRISPVYKRGDVLAGSTSTDAVRSINRAAARNNAVRRNSMLPDDYLPPAA